MSDLYTKSIFDGSLEDLLSKKVLLAIRSGRRNYYGAYACLLTAIITSFIATLAVSFDFQKQVVAILTALPGVVLLLNSVFCFEKKSDWHYRRVWAYNAFLQRLKYEGADIKEVSVELRSFDNKMQPEYPQFGIIPRSQSAK